MNVPPAQAEREKQELLCLAGNLRAARARTKLSQREVERATGYTQPVLCHWEQGRRPPSVAALFRLARLYGVSVGDLMTAVNRPARSGRTR